MSKKEFNPRDLPPDPKELPRVRIEDVYKVYRPEAKIVHSEDPNIPVELSFERGLQAQFGVNAHTVGSKRLTQQRTIIPPGQCNERHVHLNAEASMYIVRGNPVVWVGPEAKEYGLRPGNFIYIPEGLIHGIGNPSDTEEVELIASYGGASCGYSANTRMFIDDDDFPRKGWAEDWRKKQPK